MTERAKHWQSLIRAQERSGLTQAAFCRQRRINPGTFAWWRRKLHVDSGAELASIARRRSRGVPSGTAPLRFREVGVVAAEPRLYEIALRGGRLVRVPCDFDPAQVTRLIQAVESAC